MKQSLWLIAILCAFCIAGTFPSRAAAQGVHYNDVARTADNTPLNDGLVAVCSANPTTPGNVGQPCAPLTAIYTDATLATPATNPIHADIHGNFSFWAAPGTYFIEFYSPLRATAPFSEMITLGCVPNSTAAGCGSGNSVAVSAFGAKCNDTTDDTAAIQAAVNSLPVVGALIGGTISFSGVCKTTAAINVNTPNVTFVGTGHFQFITQNPPPSYIDFQGTTPQNAINVNAQGFAMDNLGVKYPTNIGGPMLAPLAPTLTAITAPGCPAEAYFVEATYMSAQGETNISPESTITTTSGQCWQVASPSAEAGATGWRIYASSNSNNETLQVATLPIGTGFTFGGTLVNLGFRPSLNTTAFSAIFDPNGGQFDGVKIFTDLSASVGTPAQANGYTSFGCCGKLHNVYVAGFGIGIFGEGSNNDFSVEDSYVQADDVGMFVVNGADINIVRDDFEGNGTGNIKMLFGSPYKISGNYFEQQGSNPPSFNVQVGDTTIPPLSFTPTPGAITIDNNFMQCNLTVYPPAPIVVETSQVLDIERNSFSQCEHENIVDNTVSGSTAHIKMLGNISDANPLAWITNTAGLVESDVDGTGTAENPGTPYFYGLGIDSQSGPSQISFSEAGTGVWNAQASTTSFSFLKGSSPAVQFTPFGSATHPDLLSNFAAAASEVIVTQSGGSATFDASLGNMFEIIMSANVTSATLVNTQPGQWLDFIICQGGGGPWTFAWPSNVFGGGTVGTTIGPCSTQTFYVSGSNAWAAGPMTVNLTSGSAGPSLLGVAGTVPYFTSSWTSGDCLQAGASPGLITLAAGACGTGGTSTGTAVTVNGGATLANANFGNSPAAATNNLNVTWQNSGSGVSAELPIFGSSGASHALGLVPDPGATAGTTRFLREDGTWDVPPGGSGTPGGTNTAVQFNSSGSLGGDAANFSWTDANLQLAQGGQYTLSGIANPAAPALTINGTPGTTVINYVVVAMQGAAQTVGASQMTATANAILSSTNFVTIATAAVSGSTTCEVYRTQTNGVSPTTLGLIGTVACGSTLNDTGLAGTGGSPSTLNNTGQIAAQNYLGPINIEPMTFTTDTNPFNLAFTFNSSSTTFNGLKWVNTATAFHTGSFAYQFCTGSLGNVCMTLDPNGNLDVPGQITSHASGPGLYDVGTQGVFARDIPNNGTTATALNQAACYVAVSGALTVENCPTSAGHFAGVVVLGAGTTGNATVAYLGITSGVFDNATTAGDYVQLSSTVAGEFHDAGSTRPASGVIVGTVMATSSGTVNIDVQPENQ